MMWGPGDGSWVLMWVWMAMLILTLAGAFAWGYGHRWSDSSAIDVLKRRLASGEIDRDDYTKLKEDLLRDERPQRRRVRFTPFGAGPLILLVLLFLLAAPMWAVASGDWDMRDHMAWMHGRGRDTSGSPQSLAGRSADVVIEDFTFTPGNLKVPVGAEVTWTNRDSARHDATPVDGAWGTPALANGESSSVTFDQPGEYDYYCSIHPSMQARLVVD